MYKPNEREYRSFGSFETRASEESDNSLAIRGLPIVFNRETVLWEFAGIQYKEKIDPGALDGCDMSDFIFNRNHGMNDATVYARTRNKSLEWDIGKDGLNIRALLDPEDHRHVDLHRDINKGLIDKMSFSFVVKEEAYDVDTHVRTILSIKKLYDVSAVDFPAYDDTSITVARSKFSEEYEKEFRELEERRRKILMLKTFC